MSACDCQSKRIPSNASAAERRALDLSPAQAKEWAGRIIHQPNCARHVDVTRGEPGVLRVIAPNRG